MKQQLGTLNGYPVIARALVPNREGYVPNRSIVLVDRAAHTAPRYVVAAHVDGETSWDLGHYTNDLAHALAVFAERYLAKVQ